MNHLICEFISETSLIENLKNIYLAIMVGTNYLNSKLYIKLSSIHLLFYLCLFIAAVSCPIKAQKNCTSTNKAFQAGESLNFKIYYNWGVIWMDAGEVSFSATITELNARKVYHFVGAGGSYPKYDWFYKVNDKYESYFDTLTLKPLRFIRDVHEGGTSAKDDYIFNFQKNKIYTMEKRNNKPAKLDSINITSCTNDIGTAIYYTRCLDFSKSKKNDTIPITFVLDGKVYYSYIRYLGKEIINSELLGNVRCIKFSPKLVEGTIFKGGEGMVVWVTDDENKIPIYVETPIIVGVIKVKLSGYYGLRNKIDCIISK